MTDRWYDKTPEQISKILSVNIRNGLSQKEAGKRLKKFGHNDIYPPSSNPFKDYLGNIFKDFTLYLMLLTAIVSGIYQQYSQAIVMITILVLNILLVLFTFLLSRHVYDDINQISLPDAKVIRGGKIYLSKQTLLVPGDIIVISAGDIIPADARLFESDGLMVNELNLSGYERSVAKDAGYTFGKDTPVGDRRNMVFASSVVTSGMGKAIVCDTGVGTLLHAKTDEKNKDKKTTIQIIEKLKGYCKKVGLFLIVLTFLFAMIDFIFGGGTKNLADIFIPALCIIVASMSELYAAFGYIIIASGIFNAIKRYKDINSGAIIKRVNSLNEVKDISCIIAPKEAFITNANPLIEKVFSDDTEADKSMRNFELKAKKVIKYAVLSTGLYTQSRLSERNTGNRINYTKEESSILKAAGACELFNHSIEKEFAFISHRGKGRANRFDTTLTRHASGNVIICRGDAAGILSCCRYYSYKGKLLPLDREKINQYLNYASRTRKKAFQVIGIASKSVKESNLDKINAMQSNMTFEGFICIHEPILDGAYINVEKCRNAGIKVIMTSPYVNETDIHVAEAIGIVKSRKDILDFARADSEDFTRDIFKVNLLSSSLYQGISSIQLNKAIQLLQENGHKVCALGSGLSDLKIAQTTDVAAAQSITISTKSTDGKVRVASLSAYESNTPVTIKNPSSSKVTGCDAVKFISDIVVSEPNKDGSGGFNALVGAIQCGKVIYANIYRAIKYFITANISRIVLFIISSLTHHQFFSSNQILICGLIFDFFAILSMAFEKPGSDILNDKTNYEELLKNPIKFDFEPIIIGIIWPLLSMLFTLLFTSLYSKQGYAMNGFIFVTHIMIQLAVLFEFKKGKKEVKTLTINGFSLGYVVLIVLFVIFCLILPTFGTVFGIGGFPTISLLFLLILPIFTITVCELIKKLYPKISIKKLVMIDNQRSNKEFFKKISKGVEVDARDTDEKFSKTEVIEIMEERKLKDVEEDNKAISDEEIEYIIPDMNVIEESEYNNSSADENESYEELANKLVANEINKILYDNEYYFSEGKNIENEGENTNGQQ